ncbi:MAG: hypothetical protein RBQ97_04495 [Acholeplasma sp.]|nr:hypothetical protein [Acholeplasma sp.]
MKNVLVVIGNYVSSPSSTANCIKPLISRLADFYNVDVLTDRKSLDFPPHQLIGGINVYSVDDYRVMNTTYLNNLCEIDTGKVLKIITKLFSILIKGFYYLRFVMFSKEKISGGWEVNRIFHQYIILSKEKDYDLVISVSLPFQSHYVAKKIKEARVDNLKWIAYEFDPYYYNTSIKASKSRRSRMKLDELEVFDKCDALIFTPELHDYYLKNGFIKESEKLHSLPYATLNIVQHNNTTKLLNNFMNPREINCLFAGQLYDDIRNPRGLLAVFSRVSPSINLIMMTNYSVEKLQMYSVDGFLPTIVPFQTHETTLFNLREADVLINIGNTVEFQAPAKIFEYISTGKPIIHFSKIKDDPVLKYLKNYPSKLIVNEWEADKIDYTQLVNEFCINSLNQKVRESDIINLLSEFTPVNVIDKFLNITRELLCVK